MKSLDQIQEDKRFQLQARGEDGGNGWVCVKGKNLAVVFSWGGGWDHVSVSLGNRCPTWEEMCVVKDMFFREDECCVEYHPRKADYVNIFPYCLHIWRPQMAELPVPPRIMV